MKTLVMQFLVCLIIFGAVFTLSKTQSPFFDAIKDTFSDELSKNIKKEDIEEAFKQIGGLSSAEETDETTVPETTDETANVKESATTTEKSTEETDENLTVSVIAEGGSDVSVDSKNEIPSNVSLKNYKLNRTMYLPVKGSVSSKFGFRIHPISGDYGFHSGIDLAADSGTEIHAAFDGTVVKADYDKWNGNYLKIKHDNGIMTVYCHCKKLYVEEGTVVRGGEIIALVGSTGSSTEPHLHFEIRIDDVSYNPSFALKTAVNAV